MTEKPIVTRTVVFEPVDGELFKITTVVTRAPVQEREKAELAKRKAALEAELASISAAVDAMPKEVGQVKGEDISP